MRQMSSQKIEESSMSAKQWWEQDPLPKFIKDTYGDTYEHVYGDVYRTQSGRVATISRLDDAMSPITVLGDEPPKYWRSESNKARSESSKIRLEACNLDW